MGFGFVFKIECFVWGFMFGTYLVGSSFNGASDGTSDGDWLRGEYLVVL